MDINVNLGFCDTKRGIYVFSSLRLYQQQRDTRKHSLAFRLETVAVMYTSVNCVQNSRATDAETGDLCADILVCRIAKVFTREE